jgi:hypothetical protein
MGQAFARGVGEVACSGPLLACRMHRLSISKIRKGDPNIVLV